jgi:hypothetical protein
VSAPETSEMRSLTDGLDLSTDGYYVMGLNYPIARDS